MSSTFNKLRVLGASAAIAAGFAMQPVMAAPVTVGLSSNGKGSAVVVPYYTVNNGWRTLLNMTNTTDNTLAVKVRLHEARNSRDVMDFYVVLSPRDVWTVTFQQNGQRLAAVTSDKSCTVPLTLPSAAGAGGTSTNGFDYNEAFDGISNGGLTDSFAAPLYSVDWNATKEIDSAEGLKRTREGYIEILTVGQTDLDPNNIANKDTIAYNAKHQLALGSAPRDCAAVAKAFEANTLPGGAGAYLGDLNNDDLVDLATGNLKALPSRNGHPVAAEQMLVSDVAKWSDTPLKVAVTLFNEGESITTDIPVLNLSGYGRLNNGAGEANNGVVGVGAVAPLLTAQNYPFYFEPTLASGDGLWTTTGLADVENLIGFKTVTNGWVGSADGARNAEWVVTFPTKRFAVDAMGRDIQAGCNAWRVDFATPQNQAGLAAGACTGGLASSAAFTKPFSRTTGESAVTATYNYWDREENEKEGGASGGVSVSPSRPGVNRSEALVYEANVLKIARTVGASDILGSSLAKNVELNNLPGTAQTGVFEVTLPAAVPVIGFSILKRDFGAGFDANASPHAYSR